MNEGQSIKRWDRWAWSLGFIFIGIAMELLDRSFKSSLGVNFSSDPFPPLITSWEYPVLLTINLSFHHQILDSFFIVTSLAGSSLPPLVLCSLLYFFGRRREAILILIALMVGDLITLFFKVVVPRPRPFMLLPVIQLEDTSGPGFPSGHSVTSFALATVISRRLPSYRFYGYGLAIIVAVGRVYLGVHFPFDVVVGSILGWCSGFFIVRLDTYLSKIR